MHQHFTTLETLIRQESLIIGIGNTLRGDDAAGLELVGLLQKQGYPATLLVGGNPENYLNKIAAVPCTNRLWVDIVHFNGTPGEWRLFSSQEIGHYAISTHNFSLELLFKYLNTIQPAEDVCLGIQPQQTSLGESLSRPVYQTIQELSTRIMEIWASHRQQP